MKKGTLTREQAIEAVGEAAVLAVEAEGCEPTCRVGYNGACQGDAECEWTAGVSAKDADGYSVRLTSYYYTSNAEDEAIAEYDGDGSWIDWEVEGYDVD